MPEVPVFSQYKCQEGEHLGVKNNALTAAELAGTTFPEDVMIQPLGTPATSVRTAVWVARVEVPTHGQPVCCAVSVFEFPPKPAGIDGEADVIAGTLAVDATVPAPPAFPFTFPPTA